MKNQYVKLFEIRKTLGVSSAAMVARLAMAMLPLSITLMLLDKNSSPNVAGSAVAFFFMGVGISFPIISAISQKTSIKWAFSLSTLACAAVGLFVLRMVTDVDRAVSPQAFFLLGLSVAPVGPSMRALWSEQTNDSQLLHTASSFEATLTEFLFIVGPFLASLIAIFYSSQMTFEVALGLLVSGTLIFGLVRPVDMPLVRIDNSGSANILTPELIRILISIGLTSSMSTSLVLALAFGLENFGGESYTGFYLGLHSFTSVVGGVCFGLMTRDYDFMRTYKVILMVLICGFFGLPLSLLFESVATMGAQVVLITWAVMLTALGLFIAPMCTVEFQIVASLNRTNTTKVAFAYVGSSIFFGAAFGAWVVGQVAVLDSLLLILSIPAAFAILALMVAIVPLQASREIIR